MFRTAGVETVVFDIQDVGSRFYTYIWTMYTGHAAPPTASAPVSSSSTGPTRSAEWRGVR